jgi:hypothetical protein
VTIEFFKIQVALIQISDGASDHHLLKSFSSRSPTLSGPRYADTVRASHESAFKLLIEWQVDGPSSQSPAAPAAARSRNLTHNDPEPRQGAHAAAPADPGPEGAKAWTPDPRRSARFKFGPPAKPSRRRLPSASESGAEDRGKGLAVDCWAQEPLVLVSGQLVFTH